MSSSVSGRLGPADFANLKRTKIVGVTMTSDNVADVVRAVAELTKQQVLIGVAAENAMRDPDDGDGPSYSEVGYINEFGVPERNIPPRPHLVPGVQVYLPTAVKRLKAAAVGALNGDTKAITTQFNAIGLEASSSVQDMIHGTLSPPLSPKTIYARQHRKTLKGLPVARRFGTQPLIDFGRYILHLSYVIRKVK